MSSSFITGIRSKFKNQPVDPLIIPSAKLEPEEPPATADTQKPSTRIFSWFTGSPGPGTMEKQGRKLAKGGLHIVEQHLISPEFRQHTKNFVNSLLFAQVSQGILELNTMLQLCLKSTQGPTDDDINRMRERINFLIDSDLINAKEKEDLQQLNLLLTPTGDNNPFETDYENIRLKIVSDKEHLQNYAKTVSDFIHRQQGSLVNAVDFLKDAILDPEKGILHEANIQLTTADDSVLKNALAVLTQALFGQRHQELTAQGVAGGLSRVARETLRDGISDTEDRLRSEPHSLLAKFKEKIEQCKKAFATSSVEARQLANQALPLVQEIIENRQIIFIQPPLTEEENGVLDDIARYFQKLDEYTFDAAHIERIEGFVGKLYAKQENLLELAADILNKKIVDPLKDYFDHLIETAPATLLQNAKKALGIMESGPAGSAAQGQAIGGFLDAMGGFFDQMLSKGAAALTNKAFGSVASLIVSFVQNVHDKVDPKFAEQRDALDKLIVKINGLKATGISYQALGALFSELVGICDQMNISVAGGYLPHFNGSDHAEDETPAADAYQNIELLKKAHEDLTVPVKQDYEAIARKQKDIFIAKTTDFLTLKFTSEWICHRPADRSSYLRMMDMARQPNAASLLTLIIRDIKAQKNVPWYTTWWNVICAWLLYKVMHSLVQTLIKHASDAYLTEAIEYIKKGNFEDFTAARISNADNYLTILNSAFASLPKIEPAYGNLSTMIKKEMEDPRRNNGLAVDKIYREFENNLIKKATDTFALSLLRPLIRFVLWRLRKKQDWVKSVIDDTVGSLRDVNGYSHAFNTVVIPLLEDLETSIKAAAHSPRQITASPPVSMPAARKKALAGLVKNLFHVLEKSKCDEIEDIRDLEKGKKPVNDLFDVIKQRLDETFNINIEKLVVNEMIDNSTFVVADAMGLLMQEDQLQKLTCNFIELLNHTYDVDAEQPSKPERNRTENRVQELANNILRESISQAIDQRGDLLQEQSEVNAAVEELRDMTKKWIESAAEKFAALEQMNGPQKMQMRVKIGTLYYEMKAFQEKLDLMKGRITNNHWKQDLNKNVVIERLQKVERASHALVQMIKDVEREMFLLEKYDAISLHLQDMFQAMGAIEGPSFSSADCLELLKPIDKVVNDDEILKNLKLFIPSDQRDTFTANLKQKFRDFSLAVQEMHRVDAQRIIIKKLFETQPSLIDQIIEGKRTKSSTLAQLISSTQKQILETLPENKRTRFVTALNNLVKAKTQSDEERTQKELFEALCNQTLLEANASYNECAQLARQHRDAIQNAIGGLHLLDQNYSGTRIAAVGETLNRAQELMENFRDKCKKALTDVPFVNLFNLNILKKPAKKIVFNTAKGYVDELIQFVVRKDTGYSLLNHMVLMPYNKYEQEGGLAAVGTYTNVGTRFDPKADTRIILKV